MEIRGSVVIFPHPPEDKKKVQSSSLESKSINNYLHSLLLLIAFCGGNPLKVQARHLQRSQNCQGIIEPPEPPGEDIAFTKSDAS